MSDPIVVEINDRWRVASDDLQWMLQRNHPKQWLNVAYCTTRLGLEIGLREGIESEMRNDKSRAWTKVEIEAAVAKATATLAGLPGYVNGGDPAPIVDKIERGGKKRQWTAAYKKGLLVWKSSELPRARK